MFKKILVPLDMSSIAEVVLPYAVEIAAYFEGLIELVTVSEAGAPAQPTETRIDGMDRSHLAYFLKVVEQVRLNADKYGAKERLQVRTKVLTGKPANEILRYADENDTSLILMASHGSSGPGKWTIGGIAAKVLSASSRPVLLIKAPAVQVPKQKGMIKKILVPLDGSKLGEAGLPYAEGLATKLQAELVLLNVIEPQTTWGMYEGYSTYRAPEPPDERSATANRYLDDTARPLKERGLNVICEVKTGLPPRKIIDYARDNSVDLIAMSTNGRSGIMEWVFGSVTDKVLHVSDTPVLVVRPA